jgi:hypothetical protein
MLNNYEDILNWTKEGDIMILDRGFRDSLDILKALGIDATMPSFLGQNQRQFDVYDANRSHFITKLRWAVESVNARLKRFKWFSQTIQNSSLPSFPDFIAIVATLTNCFHVPMAAASPDDDNLMRHRIWQATDVNNLAEPFLILSLDDIRSLTLDIKVF